MEWKEEKDRGKKGKGEGEGGYRKISNNLDMIKKKIGVKVSCNKLKCLFIISNNFE